MLQLKPHKVFEKNRFKNHCLYMKFFEKCCKREKRVSEYLFFAVLVAEPDNGIYAAWSWTG